MKTEFEQQLIDYVHRNRDGLVRLVSDLVRCPSENTPPDGNEGPCQQYIASALRRAGYRPELYELSAAPGLL
jgi:acetylornithine deacetylase/succinyl-diaminopimelate desuccinylase-like protein